MGSAIKNYDDFYYTVLSGLFHNKLYDLFWKVENLFMEIFIEGSVQGVILSDYGQFLSAGRSDQFITPYMEGSRSHDLPHFRDII